MRKKVCVVGAGLSGLCVIKELKEEGHEVTCYEAGEKIGGAFSKRSSSSKVYDSLLLTVSNYFMAYSALPPNLEESRRYWSGYEYERYLRDYVDKFSLLPHILHKINVLEITKNSNGYQVTIEDECSNKSQENFDAVVICTGTNRVPSLPYVEGIDSFKGEVMHTVDYENADRFRDKKVVCVGIGESGVDIAHELADVTKSCTLLSRTIPSIVPRWIRQHTGDAYTSLSLNALGEHGVNFFMKLKARWLLASKKHMEASEKLHYEWILKSPGFFNRFLTKNDIFLDDIAKGRMDFMISEIKCVSENHVEFTNGEMVEADTIIFNTGYKENFDSLKSFIKIENIRDLYKHMIHPDIGPSLSFVGWARPTQGGVPACSEMQARYLSLLLSDKKKLPDTAALKLKIEGDRAWEEEHFRYSKHIKGLVNYHQFMKGMADLIGCKPNVNFLLNPYLVHKMWYGAHLPNFYRLNGPGADPRASKRIIKVLPIAPSFGRSFVITVVTLITKLSPKRLFSRSHRDKVLGSLSGK